ncbi:MAG: FliH/SctL family protein [Candidatus Eremiobacteraeota bacterium]|nr:FliH/SctL family protein [Candidatus Eremiobacteraeota bacterium]
MGKIVKAAHVTGEKYIVNVPRVHAAFVSSYASVSDERFESPPAPIEGIDGPPVFEPRVDFEALRRDAEAIVERAAADAESMIDRSRNAALDIVETAKREGSAIEEQSRSRGYDDGLRDGKAAADADMTEMVHTLHGLMESIRDQRATALESAEPELVRLAMTIAERVVHEQISVDPNVVVENVRSALTRLVSREVITLRVHPSDLETMRQHRDAIVAVSDVEHLRIVEDQRVDRGGVVVETDAGTIDAKIATQLHEARRAISARDEIAT